MATAFHLQRMLGIICSVFDAYSAVMFLAEPGSAVFKVRASFSLGDKIDRTYEVESGKGLVGWIVKNSSPLLINKFDETRNRLGYYLANEEREIKAFMGTPMGGGKGVLCLDSKRIYSFSEKDQKILRLFADTIVDVDTEFNRLLNLDAEIIYYHGINALLEIRQRHKKWNDFLRAYLQVVAETTGLPYCFFVAADEDMKSGHVEGATKPLFRSEYNETGNFALGPGMAGWVMKNSAPLFSLESSPGSPITPLFGHAPETLPFKSAICIPLSSGRTTMGILGLASLSLVQMPESMKIFAQNAGNYLALFLESLYLRNKLAQSTARLRQGQEGN